MGWQDYAGPVAVGTALVERDWAKRDTVTDQDFEREQVARQEEFQTTSATTAYRRDKHAAKVQVQRDRATHGSRYQRSMADMKKAGLNPMLAYQQGGGSTAGAPTVRSASPSGAKGSARGTKPTSIDIMGAVQKGSQSRLNQKNIDVADASIRVSDSVVKMNSAKTLQTDTDTLKKMAETENQLTTNQILKLKEAQRKISGDSILGRNIYSILRMGRAGIDQLKEIFQAIKNNQGKGRLKKTTPTMKTKSRRHTYGKATNKKAVRQKYRRRDAGPR